MKNEFGKRISVLINSPHYREAAARYGDWAKRVRTASRPETMAIIREKGLFFHRMKKERPGLCAFFEGEDKALNEAIALRLCGRVIVLEASSGCGK